MFVGEVARQSGRVLHRPALSEQYGADAGPTPVMPTLSARLGVLVRCSRKFELSIDSMTNATNHTLTTDDFSIFQNF